MNAQIQRLHGLYCELTGFQLRIGLGEYTREAAWLHWVRAGFGEEDLRLVIRYLKKQIEKGDRRPGALKFSNLIERLDVFEEDLALAKGWARNATPPPGALAKTLGILRPSAAEPRQNGQPDAKPISEYIAKLRKAAE